MRRLSCQEVLDQLWEYLDDEARAELCSEIDNHLNGCRDCRLEVDSLRRTILLYRADEPPTAPVLLSDKLRDALQRAYHERTGSD